MADDKIVNLVPKNVESPIKHLIVVFDDGEKLDFDYVEWGVSSANGNILYLHDKVPEDRALEDMPNYVINLAKVKWVGKDNSQKNTSLSGIS